MLDQTFIFKNKRAKSKGVELQEPISISAAVPNVSEFAIPGRNGTIIDHDGSYANRTITARCYLLDHALEKGIDEVNAWLMRDAGYFRFEDSQDTKHFMLARAVRGIDKNASVGLLNPFTLEFDAKPQRFLKIGEKAVDVTETKSIYNPTSFPALPLIELSGSGDIAVTIFGVTLNVFGLNGMITYDAETDNAYNGTQNLNSIVGTTDALTVPNGRNEIIVTGAVNSLKITPRWWEL
jgi:phage-related protein